MTREEWNTLEAGSVVSNLSGTNWRVVIEASNRSKSIVLPSDRDWNHTGRTTYCSGDKYLFKLVPVRIRLKT